MPLALLLLVGLGLYWGFRHARATGLIQGDASRWVFALLVVAALVLVLARMGQQWAAGALAAAVGIGWRWLPRLMALGRSSPARRSQGMDRDEALKVLGLSEQATDEQINDEYRRLMKQLHPDRGGSEYLAAKINEARRVLLGR